MAIGNLSKEVATTQERQGTNDPTEGPFSGNQHRKTTSTGDHGPSGETNGIGALATVHASNSATTSSRNFLNGGAEHSHEEPRPKKQVHTRSSQTEQLGNGVIPKLLRRTNSGALRIGNDPSQKLQRVLQLSYYNTLNGDEEILHTDGEECNKKVSGDFDTEPSDITQRKRENPNVSANQQPGQHEVHHLEHKGEHKPLCDAFGFGLFIQSSAVGLMGGIAVMWRDNFIHLDNLLTSPQGIYVIIKGDANTKFFQTSTLNRRRNKILLLKDNASTHIQGDKGITDHTTNFFGTLYSSDQCQPNRCNPWPLNSLFLSEESKTNLAALMRDSEIITVLKSFHPKKAPGPDRLYPLFYQKYWATGGSKTIDFCHKIFRDKEMPKEANTTYLCLIPKCPNANTIRNFIPIGLCNFTYKIITKILVNRIKPYLDHIIGPTQASFLANRRAADNAIVVQEYISHFKKMKGRQARMILKIHLEKAFNRIKWAFIHDTLLQFNFPQDIIDLIMSCVSSSSISILINGNPIPFFELSRGIKQGDPLSPYLFILCTERLSKNINLAVKQKDWNSIRISSNGPKMSHLFFADDLTLFAQANPKNCRTILKILNDFHENSRQKMNNS
ncbi:hypothetical protein FXO37_11590 [Capsicum annuum]|nr:hypothetical protein FXO37_11590 [Capsicum annuum]